MKRCIATLFVALVALPSAAFAIPPEQVPRHPEPPPLVHPRVEGVVVGVDLRHLLRRLPYGVLCGAVCGVFRRGAHAALILSPADFDGELHGQYQYETVQYRKRGGTGWRAGVTDDAAETR